MGTIRLGNRGNEEQVEVVLPTMNSQEMAEERKIEAPKGLIRLGRVAQEAVKSNVKEVSAKEVVEDRLAVEEAGSSKRRVSSKKVRGDILKEMRLPRHRQMTLNEDSGILFEETDKRGVHEKVYRKNNGTMKQVITVHPMHYQVAGEEGLREIDSELEDKGDHYETKAGRYKISVAKDTAQDGTMRLFDDEISIEWNYLDGGVKAAVSVERKEKAMIAERALSAVKYDDAAHATDLEYSIVGGNVKENIIVRERRAEYRYRFQLRLKGVTPRLSEDGLRIEFYKTTNGEKVAEIPAPFMYDATGARSDEVYYELEESAGAYLFGVIADSTWVNDENRRFPVTIDPQLVISDSSMVTCQVTELRYNASRFTWETHGTCASSAIFVYADGGTSKISNVTIDLSKIKKWKDRVVSARVYFKVDACDSSKECSLRVAERHFNDLLVGSEVFYDFAKELNSGATTATVTIRPSEASHGAYMQTNMRLLCSSARIEIEYLIDDKVKPVEKSFELMNGLGAKVNMLTGETVLGFSDVPADDFLLGMGISHIFKLTGEECNCGANFRLSINERLNKVSDAALNANYIYTDSFGTKYGIQDHYYYLQSGEPIYIDKSVVKTDSAGQLTYNGHEVVKEQRTLSGYTVLSGGVQFAVVIDAQKEIAELSKLWNKPVSYLTNGNYVKGFNKEGQLVAVFDGYNNSAFIVHDSNGKIDCIYDNVREKITFAYNEKKLLQSITDARGRATNYAYDAYKRLKKVTFANGKKITFSYDGSGNILQAESTDGERVDLTHSNGIRSVERFSTAGEIKSGKTTLDHTPVSISKVVFDYSGNYTIVDDENDHREMYIFDEDGNLTEYREECGGDVVKAEQYSLSDTVQITKYAQADTLYRKSLEEYEFKEEYSKTAHLDQFKNPYEIATTAVKISDDTTVSSVAEYKYNTAHRVTMTKETLTFSPTTMKKVVRITEYTYNDKGQVTKVRSYVEGEEENASSVEYRYNDQGKVETKISGAESDVKFYERNLYSARGQLTSRLNEFEEESVSYKYVDKTNLVSTEYYSNIGKLAYGRNAKDDTITRLTYSLPDGRSSYVGFGYTHGELTQSQNGNTTLQYVYNSKRELSSISLNGKTNYVKYEYTYGKDKDKVVKTLIARDSTMSGERFAVETDKLGNVLSTSYNEQEQVINSYYYEQLRRSQDMVTGEFEYYTYDDFKRLKTYRHGDYNEEYRYNAYGDLSTVLVNGVTKYSYKYSDDSTRKLQSVTTPDFTANYETDANGRLTKKTVMRDGAMVASEKIVYRVQGYYNSNMPAEIQFSGTIGSTAYDNQTRYKYQYDVSGNIIEIRRGTLLIAHYTYDEANRLVREDNKQLGTSTEYIYDAYGNIIKKRERSFTQATDLGNCTEIAYGYNKDELISYNGEGFVYDKVGNPTTYRGKTAIWEKGRQLKYYHGISFEYNGKGVRTKKKDISFTYDANGNLISQSNGLEFLYDSTGVTGVKYQGNRYFYRKDIQGNILALLDSTGKVVVEYIYDAWGNHAVVDANGNDITSTTHIGTLNPFRYRGYYYDTESGLYYLQTRYYDPEIGRFITIDGIEYVENEPLHGHNLYAYCFNNPVNYVDVNGDWPAPFSYRGWKIRFDPPRAGKNQQYHIHVKGHGEEYAQNFDGTPHDNSKGNPPKAVRDKIKEATNGKWEWKDVNKMTLPDIDLRSILWFPLPETKKSPGIIDIYLDFQHPNIVWTPWATPKEPHIFVNPIPDFKLPNIYISPMPENIAVGGGLTVLALLLLLASCCLILV